jgi:hypothetical protein
LKDIGDFETKRFEVIEPELTEYKVLKIWEATIPRLKETLRNGREKGVHVQILHELDGLVIKMERAIERNITLSQKIKEVALLRKEYSNLSRKLIFDEKGSQITLQDLDKAIEDTELLLHIADLSKLRVHKSYLQSLLDWADDKEDIKGSLLMRWCLVLIELAIAKETKCNKVAVKRLKDMLTALKSLQNKQTLVEYKATLANLYPGIISEVFDFNGQVLEKQLAIEACEFLKGRSLIAIRSYNTFDRQYWSTRSKVLGERTHYLSFTCDYYLDKIYCAFYCANGNSIAEVLPISASDVRGCHNSLDPENWSNSTSFFSKDSNPQATLSKLLVVVERLLKADEIEKGDHICIAADDPINLVPFAYLTTGKQLFVHNFSFSFVASFSDALAIYRSKLKLPTKSACGIFVARTGEKHRKEKLNRFISLSRSLTPQITNVRFADYSMSSFDNVIDAMQQQSIVHFDSHGHFESNTNPYDKAGLLISDGEYSPTGRGESHNLLTPEKLLGTAIDLSEAHITLNACVSGLGRVGYGGDILGLEFAFRYLGANSVLAAHWEVDGRSSDKFLHQFYKLWLNKELPRGVAWRQAILSNIATSSCQSLVEVAKMFSFDRR